VSPLKQILLACIVGPFIAVGAIAVADYIVNIKPKSHSAPLTYVTGYINNEFVNLKIVKYQLYQISS